MLEKLLTEAETTLVCHLDKGDIDIARRFILDAIPAVEHIVEPIVPEKAKQRLKRKLQLTNDGTYASTKGYYLQKRRKEKIREKEFGKELILLETENEKRRIKIWFENSGQFEQQYGRTFRMPQDIAVMNGVFESREEFLEAIDEMEEAKRILTIVKEATEPGWDAAIPLWENGYSTLTREVGKQLHGLLLDIKDPEFLVSDVHHRGTAHGDVEVRTASRNLTYPKGHGTRQINDPFHTFSHPSYSIDKLKVFTALVVQSKQNTLPFGKAMTAVDRGSAREAGIRHSVNIDQFDHQRPELVNSSLMQRLKFVYDTNRDDPELQQWLGWYKNQILTRWKATAVDHDRIFSFYRPDWQDQRLMALFYMVQEGTKYDKDTEKLIIGRLPRLLKTMIADGILQQDDVQPPLRERYALPGEEKKAFVAKLLAGTPLRELTDVVESPRAMKLLSSGEALQVPNNDFSALTQVLEPGKRYVPLGRAKNIAIFAREELYPNNEPYFAEIYRVAEAVDQGGASIVFEGRQMQVKTLRSHKMKDQLRRMMRDVNTNIVPSDNYTIIADVPVDEFREKHLADFFAVALAYRSTMDADLVRHTYANLEKEIASLGPRWEMWLSETDKVHLEASEMGGKFTFQVMAKSPLWADEALFVASSLMEYLHDAGIPFSPKTEADECARAKARKKIEAREFEALHLDEIIGDLQTGGLGRVLAFATVDQNYTTRNLGASFSACKECGQDYITGEIKKKEWGQWDIIYGRELHALATHPQTYTDGGELKLIYEIVNASKQTIPPQSLPADINNDARAFITAFEEYVAKQPDAYEAMAEGYLESMEPEEVAGNENLELTIANLKKKNRVVEDLFDKAETIARRLQEKHPLDVSGTSGHDIVYTWVDTLLLHSFWQTDRKLLTDGTAQIGPMKVYVNK